ncbi:MAG: stage V sporulation protein T [Bacillota bacterium]|nr:stage V sporulation protein T [Bacillota bacterium]
MKATGIVRRIDDLGRVVIPKEIRRTLKIREGDPLEIYTGRDGEVIFKKYSPIGELGDFATTYAETLAKTAGMPVCITDKDNIIAVSGVPKKELSEKPLSSELEQLINEKTNFVLKPGQSRRPGIAAGSDKYMAGIVVPIISEGDAIGSVVMIDDGEETFGEVAEKLAISAAGFLGRQMEL